MNTKKNYIDENGTAVKVYNTTQISSKPCNLSDLTPTQREVPISYLYIINKYSGISSEILPVYQCPNFQEWEKANVSIAGTASSPLY